MPRCLMYEIYVETCGQSAQNQVNPATFGKVSTETSQSCVHSDVLFCKLQPPGGGRLSVKLHSEKCQVM